MPSSPVHKASLVDPSTHSPALMEMLDIKLSRPVIGYVVECVVDTVDYAMGRPSSSRGRAVGRPENATFVTFVNNVITRAEITTPVMLATLVYIDRAKPHLHIALEEWALERVFLGALIVASKYLNDSTLKNVHWALCTGVFGKRDVGRIEREFLDVLDFQLGVTEDDLLSHHDSLSAVALTSHRHRRTLVPSAAPQPRQRLDLPDLDASEEVDYSSSPSSASSASSDASPRTPSTLGSPALPESTQAEPSKAHSRSQSQPHPPSESQPLSQPERKSSSSFHFNSLIRSIPIDIPRSSRHSRYSSHPKSESRPNSHYKPMPVLSQVVA